MNRVRLNPQRNSLFDLDNFFNGFYQPAPAVKSASKTEGRVFSPRVDIYEQEDSYQLIAELAGFSKENINITVDDSVLTIEANNEVVASDEVETEQPKAKVLRKERISGKFARSFNLGQDINAAGIQAEFKDGLLTLTVPKVEESVKKPLQIDIH